MEKQHARPPSEESKSSQGAPAEPDVVMVPLVALKVM
jgi:hypothetical protein